MIGEVCVDKVKQNTSYAILIAGNVTGRSEWIDLDLANIPKLIRFMIELYRKQKRERRKHIRISGRSR
jgi:hypothetical protein